MLEVEAKVRLDDPEALRRRLVDLGAVAQEVQEQRDAFFRHPQRDLAAGDEALRLRQVGSRFELTYKGPRHAGSGAKARIEQTVAMAQDPTALLESLGFQVAVRLAKRREPFHWGRLTACIDWLDGLGVFLEVEAMGPDAETARHEVAAALQRLGLGDQPLVQEAYIELAVRAGTQARE